MPVRTAHIAPPVYRTENYHQGWWHFARLDLMGFMVQRADSLPDSIVNEARSLYGTNEQCDHYCPSWHVKAHLYVATVYSFIEDCKQHLAQRRAA